MTTITIPKKLIKEEDLVVIPRKEYEKLLRAKRGGSTVVKRSKSFKVPIKHKKFYDQLDKKLTKVLCEVNEGKTIGPFDNAKDLIKSLHS